MKLPHEQLAPQAAIKALKRSSARDRIDYCAAMLAVYGFISGSERRNVGRRVAKWQGKHAKL